MVLSHSPASSLTVRLNSGWSNNHRVTETASTSVKLPQTLAFGADALVYVLSGQDPRAGSDEVSFVQRLPIFDFEAAFLALPCRTHVALGSGLGADKALSAQKMKPASRRLTDGFMLIIMRMSFRGFACMRATHSFILGIGHLLLSVASAATRNHWHRTPQAMHA